MSERERTVGWKLDRGERAALLERFRPAYANLVADHVTLQSGVGADALLPTVERDAIVGQINDDAGVQALIVSIDGKTARPDGGTYHITWSLADGREARESNDVIAERGWHALPEPVPLSLEPSRF